MSLNDILFTHNSIGASAATAKQDKLSAGLKASQQMAETDRPKLLKYAADFIAVGQKYGLPPALLAAIASRETRAGTQLGSSGFGVNGADFGLMQVNKDSHKLVGGAFSRAHIDQATGILKSFYMQVMDKHKAWTPAQQLRGAVAAYNFGVSNVRSWSELDRGTANHDYSSDVWARAQALAPHIGGVSSAAGKTTVSGSKNESPKLVVVTTPGTKTQGVQEDSVVKELQMFLVKHGYMTDQQVKTGPGILGPQTRAALSKFLEQKGSADKSITPNTEPPPPVEETTQNAATKAVVEMDGVPLYNQADPRWAGEELGSGLLIGPKGCAMTATAMAISKISGQPINPLDLDKYLDSHAGYEENNIRWDVGAQARGLRATWPFPLWNLSTIDKELTAGRPVVVGVHYKGGAGTDHWVTIVGKVIVGGSPVYTAHDPAKGQKFSFIVEGGTLRASRSPQPRAPGYTAAVPNYITTGELRTFYKAGTKKLAS